MNERLFENKRLIGAAGDLLAALESLVKSDDIDYICRENPEIDELMFAARAAIKKARGE